VPALAHSQEDPEAGTDDPPPSYGELHGRVLGSGLPPPAEDVGSQRGVRMVSEQDLEDVDE
jgi:hypothetical protein